MFRLPPSKLKVERWTLEVERSSSQVLCLVSTRLVSPYFGGEVGDGIQLASGDVSWANKRDCGEVSFVAGFVSGQEGVTRCLGVGTDEEVWQG